MTQSSGSAAPWHTTLCRAVLVLLALYHLTTGVVAVCFPEFSRTFYATLYHFEPHYWEQYRLILKPWGSYAFFTGLLMALAAYDPRRYRAVIACVILLLSIRIGYRVLYAAEAAEVFRIDAARNALNVGLIVVWVAVLSSWSILDLRRGTVSEADADADAEPKPRTLEGSPA